MLNDPVEQAHTDKMIATHTTHKTIKPYVICSNTTILLLIIIITVITTHIIIVITTICLIIIIIIHGGQGPRARCGRRFRFAFTTISIN